MNEQTVAVIIRVYDRMADLEVCVDCIRRLWHRFIYHLIVVGNGKANGLSIPEAVLNSADQVIELEENAGHFNGNAQLLLAGIKQIPAECRYTVILEADTWLFSDRQIAAYITKLDQSEAVWASSEWVKKYWSLGLDLAIIKTSFLKDNCDIFRFGANPEAHVCNFLMAKGRQFIYIRENMPVHIPKIMRFKHKGLGGRFRSFPCAKMITHHVEDLGDGIDSKKLLANYCLGKKIFPVGNSFIIKLEFLKLLLLRCCAIIAPQSSWVKTKKRVCAK